jgi:uncharacterized membrane protein
MSTVLATSFQVPGDVSFYNLVVFLHIASLVVGLGVIFVFPVFLRIGLARDPRGLPLFHRVQDMLGTRVITAGLAGLLLTGIYLALAGPFEFSDLFVGIGLLVVILNGALGGLYYAKRIPRLQALAERDIAAAGGKPQVTLSKEYVDLARQVELIGYVSAGSVLLALMFMVFKPGV